jgi:hypothetical protein
MKLYACFTVFDGLELLDHSFDSIIPFVDGVVICYQEISNKGNRSDEVSEYLKRFVNHSEVQLVKYYTDLSFKPKENERRKHQLMIEKAREAGATHFLMMATDHFYRGVEFYRAKQQLRINEHITTTFTQMFTYYKKPEWQLDPPETYWMPFISKILPDTKIQRSSTYPVYVDPSVQVHPIGEYYCFKPDEIMLHHYSMVRKNEASILGKFQNAASPWKPEQIQAFTDEFASYDLARNPGIKYFSGAKVKVVDDFFALNRIFKP